jgi:hypothetical protein
MHRSFLPCWVLSFLTLLACNRPATSTSSPEPVASASPAASASSASGGPAPADPLRDLLRRLPLYEQPREATLAHEGYQALLASVLDVVRRRFDGIPEEQVKLQVIPLLSDARAVLLHAPGHGARPLIVALDAQRSMLWIKERVIDDLSPDISAVALCPGPDGELILFFHDPPTGLLGARRWMSSGGILADFQVASSLPPDALGALYWPGRGWVVATTSNGTVRAQLLGEDGKARWGAEGRRIAQESALPGPLRLALDTEVSVHLLWPGKGLTGRHHLAMRLDFEGVPLWRAPVDLGDAAEGPDPGRVERVENGLVRAHLAGRVAPYTVEVTAEGKVRIP